MSDKTVIKPQDMHATGTTDSVAAVADTSTETPSTDATATTDDMHATDEPITTKDMHATSEPFKPTK
ncbi:hypothetical protein ACIO93_38075 [Streptomyces sp. NPDC087903]|uniref:hypothetical protein n=1 Tax=Streptomyces sp. NPDC087903 TaxID=3365819 RepID=UPI0037F52814